MPCLLFERVPSGFMSALETLPEQIDGSTDAHIKLSFLVEDNLSVDEIDFNISARLHDVAANNIISTQDIHDGQLSLKFQGRLISEGISFLESIPASLEAGGILVPDVPYRGHYNIVSKVDNVQDLGNFGNEFMPFLGSILKVVFLLTSK